MKRIHIVGVSPRTGTTLLAECMRLCFDIDAFEEHEETLRKLRWGASVYLTKYPRDILYMKSRLTLDPRLTVICMMRDPRDVVVSRHEKAPDRYWTNLGRWKIRNSIVKKHMSHQRFVVIKYEDLICDPDGVQDELMSKIPYLTKTRSFSEFHKVGDVSKESVLALGGIRPIDSKNSSRWRSNLPRLLEQIQLYGEINEELIEWGYESNHDWSQKLSIPPSTTDSRSVRDDQLNRRKRYVSYPLSALLNYFCARLSLSCG